MITRTLVAALFLLHLPACYGQWHSSAFTDPTTGEEVKVASVDRKGWSRTLMVRLAGGGVLKAFGTPGTIVCAEPQRCPSRLSRNQAG